MNVVLATLFGTVITSYLTSRFVGMAWPKIQVSGGFLNRRAAWLVAAFAGLTFTWDIAIAISLFLYWRGYEPAGSWINALFFGWWTYLIPGIGVVITAMLVVSKPVRWKTAMTEDEAKRLKSAIDRYTQYLSIWPQSTKVALNGLARWRVHEAKFSGEWLWSHILSGLLSLMHLPFSGLLLARWIIFRNARDSASSYDALEGVWQAPKPSTPALCVEPTVVPQPPNVSQPSDVPTPKNVKGVFTEDEEDFFKRGNEGEGSPEL